MRGFVRTIRSIHPERKTCDETNEFIPPDCASIPISGRVRKRSQRTHLSQQWRSGAGGFKSGGNAFVSAGFTSHACTYSESGKTVNMVCDGDTTSFTVQDDGALTGPPNGLMARLTPVKN
jgi:hypothetical protein